MLNPTLEIIFDLYEPWKSHYRCFFSPVWTLEFSHSSQERCTTQLKARDKLAQAFEVRGGFSLECACALSERKLIPTDFKGSVHATRHPERDDHSRGYETNLVQEYFLYPRAAFFLNGHFS